MHRVGLEQQYAAVLAPVRQGQLAVERDLEVASGQMAGKWRRNQATRRCGVNDFGIVDVHGGSPGRVPSGTGRDASAHVR
jgi:hypothetical protein